MDHGAPVTCSLSCSSRTELSLKRGCLTARDNDQGKLLRACSYNELDPTSRFNLTAYMIHRLTILACVFLVAASACGQQFFEIQAELHMSIWRGDSLSPPPTVQSRTNWITCISGTNEWYIETDFVQNAEQKWRFDGANVYNSARITKQLSPELRDKLSAKGTFLLPPEGAESNLTIRVWESRDGHPLGDPTVNLTWLAFCSGNYLKRPDRIIPLPLEELRHTRDRFGYSDTTTTFSDELSLPQTVDLFTSKARLRASEDDFDQEAFFGDRYEEGKARKVAELVEGTLTFQYVVTESTNVLGNTFPLRFEFFQAARNNQPNGNWTRKGIGYVRSIRSTARPKSLFDPTMNQMVIDWRLRDEANKATGLIYASTNTFLLPTTDPSLQQKFAAEIARKPR